MADQTAGFNEEVRNAIVAVGTTSVLVSQARQRKELVIANTSGSSQNITLSIGQDAVANQGIFLLPYSVYSVNNNEAMTVTSLPIFAIASAGGGQISVFER